MNQENQQNLEQRTNNYNEEFLPIHIAANFLVAGASLFLGSSDISYHIGPDPGVDIYSIGCYITAAANALSGSLRLIRYTQSISHDSNK